MATASGVGTVVGDGAGVGVGLVGEQATTMRTITSPITPVFMVMPPLLVAWFPRRHRVGFGSDEARCVLVTLWGIGHEKIPRAGP